jgi:hypothetical protein
MIFEFCDGPGKTEWSVVEHASSKNPLNVEKLRALITDRWLLLARRFRGPSSLALV